LADFGLSNNWSPNSLLYTFCGSPLYASPEIVNGFPYFGPEVDCWSLGVLLYTLVYGSMPFQGGDYNRLVKQITEGQFIVPRERSGAFGLIKKCLCTKAAKRASIDDIAEHWWVNVGYAYPPVVFYSYMPGSNKSGVQALGYEGSPKVSPSIPFGSMGKKTASSLVAAAQAAAAAAAAAATSSGTSTGTPCTAGGGINTPVPSTVY
jgi:serine/threonine protein kinase